MLKVLRKAWKYMVAALSGKLDELADPKVQIEQAIDEAKRQHELLSQQAASVLGNRRQLEMKLSRGIEDVEKLQASTRQSLVLAEKATNAGNAEEARKYEDTAQAFANKLVASEASIKDLKGLHDQALQAADQARKAVESNAMLLQKKLTERTKLLSQIEQTKMRERMNEALRSVSMLSAPGDVPSLDEVREKIETRYAKALGTAEIVSDTVEARMLEVEKASIDAQGAQRLEEIRKSIAAGGSSKQVTSGDG